MLAALTAVAILSPQLGWRAGTPTPILVGNPKWVELYWKAWENLYAATVEEHEPGPWPPRVFAAGGKIDFDKTLAITLYARWGWRAHPVVDSLSYVLGNVKGEGNVASLFERDTSSGVSMAKSAPASGTSSSRSVAFFPASTGSALRQSLLRDWAAVGVREPMITAARSGARPNSATSTATSSSSATTSTTTRSPARSARPTTRWARASACRRSAGVVDQYMNRFLNRQANQFMMQVFQVRGIRNDEIMSLTFSRVKRT